MKKNIQEPSNTRDINSPGHSSWYVNKEKIDMSLRPKRLDQFLGQEQLKKNIALYIHASKQRGDALDHVFFSGSHGLGKTTLSCIIAQELGSDIKITSAPIIDKPKDIIGILSTIDANSILFIDEIHRLKAPIEEILYSAMEDFMVDWVVGSGLEAHAVRIPIQRFTLIAATTQPERVSSPLYSRFGIHERLDLYTDDDLSKIIMRSAYILKVPIEPDAAYMIGSMSRGTPRYGNSLLRRVRDFAQVKANGEITKEIVILSAKELGIDNNGLEYTDRKILKVLADNFSGKPVGLKTLAIAVNENPQSLEDFWEVYLIKKGYNKSHSTGKTDYTERSFIAWKRKSE